MHIFIYNQMYISIQSCTRIPTGRFHIILQTYSHYIFSTGIQIRCHIQIKSIITIWPIAGFFPVDINSGMAHSPIKYQSRLFASIECRNFKVQPIPTHTYKWQSARTSGMLHGLFLPVLCYSHLLPVILNTERTINSPIVRYRYRLPTAVIIIQLTEIRMI